MANRMPSGVGLTHGQIWANFRECYPELMERELLDIHRRWIKAGADAGFAKNLSRKDAVASERS